MSLVPTGYRIHGTSNNGSTLTLQKEGSTAAKPKLIILDRTEAKFNQASKAFSVPSTRMRVLCGVVDVDGNPKPERLLADVSFRTPIGSESDQAAWFADFKAFINDDDTLGLFIQQQSFPDCCPVPDEE